MIIDGCKTVFKFELVKLNHIVTSRARLLVSHNTKLNSPTTFQNPHDTITKTSLSLIQISSAESQGAGVEFTSPMCILQKHIGLIIGKLLLFAASFRSLNLFPDKNSSHSSVIRFFHLKESYFINDHSFYSVCTSLSRRMFACAQVSKKPERWVESCGISSQLLDETNQHQKSF